MELKQMVQALRGNGMHCNCDLDNWEPEASTGHSHVCRIHETAMTAKFRPHDVLAPELRALLKLDAATPTPTKEST